MKFTQTNMNQGDVNNIGMNNRRPKVFISGCFDGLHEGHKHLLNVANALGEVTVALNTDEYCQRVKGEGRPINKWSSRLRALQLCPYVRYVTGTSGGECLREAIKEYRPDFIIVGDDYKADQVVGRELAQVLIVPRLAGFSTTGGANV